MFVELFLKLLCKNWKNKLQKMNNIIESIYNEGTTHGTKPFHEAELLVGLTLIIDTLCYCQSGLVLFNTNKDYYDTWDTIMHKALLN